MHYITGHSYFFKKNMCIIHFSTRVLHTLQAFTKDMFNLKKIKTIALFPSSTLVINNNIRFF